MKKAFLLTLVLIHLISILMAHDVEYGKVILKKWELKEGRKIIDATLLMFKNGEVYIEDENNKILHFPLSSFCEKDQEYVKKKYETFGLLNRNSPHASNNAGIDREDLIIRFGLFLTLLIAVGIFFLLLAERQKRKFLSPFFFAGILLILYGFNEGEIPLSIFSTTSPGFIDSAFAVFKPKVHTHWDNNYFYVESKGIPDHEMMTGITAWQQQVPIPQCYTTANNNNAWSIPLNPVVAASPVPVNQYHFLRGAIALAVNGVPIFNPYTNTGVDAKVDGQLDNWGGHCGRADDYHYHIAPLHLYGQVALNKPIAFALDGYAVYGAKEPDGTDMTPLDLNHGHFGSNGVYHYHGTTNAPYMIGKMVGQVTEDATLQIIPQASARPIRTAGTPLSGATITACVPNTANNGYNLTYNRNSQTYQVNYSWADTINNQSRYLFHFVSPTGTVDSIFVGFSQSQCTVPISTIISFLKSMKRLPDTGELLGYTSTYGEDNDYIIDAPFFINNGDGTVTDTVTGLMWQKTDGGEMAYEKASGYCDTLTLAGYTNWRLPTPRESFSILNHQNSNPAIDGNVFTNTTAEYWWTGAEQANDPTKAWCTNTGGGIGNKPKSETISAGGTKKYHTRAVRDIATPVSLNTHFSDNGDATITDNLTNLVWQQVPFSDSLTWENALIYADTATTGGYIDWRLPNIKELQSISDEKLTSPSIDINFLKITNNKKYWSSTTLPNRASQAWFLNTQYGITSYDEKIRRNLIICVRGSSHLNGNYIFNGNGNWDKNFNWLNYAIPPILLPAGQSILIDPIAGGKCLLNVKQYISSGASIKVSAQKEFVVPEISTQ